MIAVLRFIGRNWRILLAIGLTAFVVWHVKPGPKQSETPTVNISAVKDSIRTEVQAEFRDSIRTVTVRKTITIRGADTVAVLDSAWYWENRNLYSLIEAFQTQTRVETLTVVQPAKAKNFALGLAFNWNGRVEEGSVKDNRFMLGPSFRAYRTNLAPLVGYRKGLLVGVNYTREF